MAEIKYLPSIEQVLAYLEKSADWEEGSPISTSVRLFYNERFDTTLPVFTDPADKDTLPFIITNIALCKQIKPEILVQRMRRIKVPS